MEDPKPEFSSLKQLMPNSSQEEIQTASQRLLDLVVWLLKTLGEQELTNKSNRLE